MSKITKKEMTEIEEQKDFWNRIGGPAGWRLSGWTHKNSASFITEDNDRSIQINQDHIELINAHVELQRKENEIDSRDQGSEEKLTIYKFRAVCGCDVSDQESDIDGILEGAIPICPECCEDMERV